MTEQPDRARRMMNLFVAIVASLGVIGILAIAAILLSAALAVAFVMSGGAA